MWLMFCAGNKCNSVCVCVCVCVRVKSCACKRAFKLGKSNNAFDPVYADDYLDL